MSKVIPLNIIDVENHLRTIMSRVNTHVSVSNGNFIAVFGQDMYHIISDLKTLQGNKAVFFNASDIVKQHNEKNPMKKKNLAAWTRSKRFQEIIEIWECEKNTPKNKLYRKVRIGKRYQVFVHHELFLSLLIWLDAKHEVAITNFINKAVAMSDEVQRERGISIKVFPQFTDALNSLKKKLEDEGSGFAPHTFMNVNILVYKGATGKGVKEFKEDKALAKEKGLDSPLDMLEAQGNHRVTELRLNIAYRINLRIAQGWTGKQIKDDLYAMIRG
ncbi:MAG: KilA-N domain-containing protein [Candidatus Delongbacteria bacterium]|nr:KilA-N domain-containing protein [Candidatus Delongbacteria bacterium]